jgi:NAD(P)-dependent dehydrogenase (short-subunit alcohol dehydrogenase family)
VASEGMLTGKTAIVTGSGGGVGRNTARSLASEGARVVVNDVRDGVAEAVAAEIRDSGGEAVAVTASVAEEEGAREIVDTCINAFGRLDVLVNNAAILRRHLVQETPIEDWDAVLAVHLRGTFLCCRAAIPHLIEAPAGRIINTASTAALAVIPGTTAYAVAKSGIITLSALLAKELVFDNITVNVVEPLGGGGAWSLLGSDPMSEQTQRVRLAYGWWYPPKPANAPRPPDSTIPTPVGSLMAYLASEHADYINGQIIGVTDTSVRLWSSYAVAQTLFFEPGVTPTELQERFPKTLGLNLSNPIPDLPELPH